ncbi:hypothetical protein ES332_D09G039300v1 [Gossypium tomentosum]|uniref:Pectate lyase n=1 Tax=Gossypium tomentosum TaxID=34277 RepID=A0A5D2JDW7_GOSTO|nr:hypothetical protein ES332_D09G039300v1 [Gossypium tomentosum]
MEVTKLRLVLLFYFAMLISRLWENVTKFDDFWKQREKEARKLALKAYEPSPRKYNKSFELQYNSDNGVINPKPGTLLHAVIQKKQLWIIFAHDMNIKLSEELIVQSEKTIDGRRASVHIAYGCDITLQFVLNVIIHNIHVHHVVESRGGLIRDSIDHFGFRAFGDRDGISIFGSSNIWLDHISMSECQDRLIDITHVIYALESKWKNWVWRSEGDLFMNGAFFRTSKPSSSFQFTFNKKDMIEAKPGTFVGRLTHFVGALNCKKNLENIISLLLTCQDVSDIWKISPIEKINVASINTL